MAEINQAFMKLGGKTQISSCPSCHRFRADVDDIAQIKEKHAALKAKGIRPHLSLSEELRLRAARVAGRELIF